jgi:hypothetical protein
MTTRTVPLARLRDLAITVAAAGLVVALTPIWLAHTLGTRLASARRRGGLVALDRVRASAVDVPSVLARRTPVIVEGLGEHLGLADTATPGAIVELAGDRRLGVDLNDAAAPFFLYSGGYGADVVEHRSMTVTTACSGPTTWTARCSRCSASSSRPSGRTAPRARSRASAGSGSARQA